MNVTTGLFIGGLLILTSCQVGDPDLLVAEAASPNGERAARLWCENGCETPGVAKLTLSTKSRPVELTRESEASAWEGRLPQEDVVLQILHQSPDPTLQWRSGSTLIVEGYCLRDGDGAPISTARAGTIELRFEDMAPAGSCEAQGGS